MRKIQFFPSVIFLVASCLFLTEGYSPAQDLPRVEIDSIIITPPPPSGAENSYRIQTVVKNTGNTAIPASRLNAQRYQGKAGGEWVPSGSTGLSEPLGPQETKNIWGHFNRNASKDSMKVIIFYNTGTGAAALGEKIVVLPDEAVPQFDVINFTIDERRYTATIKNLANMGISDLVIKGSTSNDPRFGQWTASEEATISFLKAKGTYEYTGTRPKDNMVVKIVILRAGQKVGEKVIDKSASTPIKNATDVKGVNPPNMSLPKRK